MAEVDRNYWDLVQRVLSEGKRSGDRTGIGTVRIFGVTFKHDMEDGFPIISMRKLWPGPVWGELAAFVRGARDINVFREFGCHYWDMNLEAYNKRCGTPDRTDLGPIYGAAWCNFEGTDQLGTLLDTIKNSPQDRRQVVIAWMPHLMADMVLPPCHILFQTFVEGHRLDMMIVQRSVDVMVGMPADLILYGTLMELIAHECGLVPGIMTYHFGDTHIYNNHLATAGQLIDKTTPRDYPACELTIERGVMVRSFLPSDLKLVGYEPSLATKFEFNA